MTFHDVRLPEDIERGAQGGPGFSTTVVTTKGGREYRSGNWTRPRHRWNIGYGVSTMEDVQAVLDFFYCRQGRLHSFRFKDWTDFQAVAQPLGISTGTETEYQLVKLYFSGEEEFTRTITKPIPISVVVYADFTPISRVVNELTGIVTIAAQASGVEITADFEFDVPVRFDIDQIEAVVRTAQSGQIPDLPLVEVLE